MGRRRKRLGLLGDYHCLEKAFTTINDRASTASISVRSRARSSNPRATTDSLHCLRRIAFIGRQRAGTSSTSIGCATPRVQRRRRRIGRVISGRPAASRSTPKTRRPPRSPGASNPFNHVRVRELCFLLLGLDTSRLQCLEQSQEPRRRMGRMPAHGDTIEQRQAWKPRCDIAVRHLDCGCGLPSASLRKKEGRCWEERNAGFPPRVHGYSTMRDFHRW